MLSISDSQSRVQVLTPLGTQDMMAEVLKAHWQHLGVSPEYLGNSVAVVVCRGFQRARTVVDKDLAGKGKLRVEVRRNVISGGRRGHRRNAGNRVITTRATVIGNDGSVLVERVAKVEFPSDFALVD